MTLLNRASLGAPTVLALLAFSTVLARALTMGQPIVNIDEQFYLLVGDRMLQGALPYVDIWDRKPPVLFGIYAGIRALGGDGIWQSTLVACAAIVGTAYFVYLLARRLSGPTGALAAGIAYTWWTALTGGLLGQAGVFFNVFMAAGALLLVRLFERRSSAARAFSTGTLVMLLAGLAVQTKQSVVFEAAYFGLAFAIIAWRRHTPMTAVGAVGVAAFAGLAPSLIILVIWYQAAAVDALLFATVTSATHRAPMLLPDYLWHFGTSLLMVLPLLAFAALGLVRVNRSDADDGQAVRLFLYGWLAVAILSLFAYDRTFYDHYLLGMLVPACVGAAPSFEQWRRYCAAMAITVIALVTAVYALQWHERSSTGGWRTIAALDAATRGQRNCPFSYGGPTAAYLLNDWCLPTAYAFAGHLTFAAESPAIGVDPRGEVARILARRPDRIILRADPGPKGNVSTRAVVEDWLSRDYELTHRIAPDGLLVYRLRPGLRPMPNPAPPLR